MPLGPLAGLGISAGAGALGGLFGGSGAKRQLRTLKRGVSDQALLAFLSTFFPQALPGGAFGQQFLAQGNQRIGATQQNLSNQLMSLLGAGGNLGGGLAGGGNAAIGLASNAQRNQLPLDLGRFQAGVTAQALPLQFQRAQLNAGIPIGPQAHQTGTGNIFAGLQQGVGAGLSAFGDQLFQRQPQQFV